MNGAGPRPGPGRGPGRGLAFAGAWLALVLAPLGVALACDPVSVARPFAVEFAVAAGFVAFALLGLELALVSRLAPASEPYGTDALMLFHRMTGLLATAFAFGHALPLAARGGRWMALLPASGPAAARAGSIALLALVALVASSLARRRLRLSWEAWRLAHGLLASTVTVAMLVHALGAGGYSRAAPVRFTLCAYLAIFVALSLRYRVVRPLRLWRRPWEVVENRDEGADTRTLVLRPVGHPGFAFQPGQFAWIDTGSSPLGSDQHPVSISSSAERPPDGTLELTIKALGDWSREVVPALPPGARVRLDGPFGAFSPDRTPGEGFVLVAGGIGITPMRSILATLCDRGDPRPVLLVYATNRPAREVFRGELARLSARMPLKVVRVHERPEPGSRDEAGLVTADLLRRHLPANAARRQVFVCGPGPMMESVEAALEALGVPADRIHTERFDMV